MEAEGTANENMCPALGGVATEATASAEGAGGGGTTVSSSAWSPPMFIFRLAFIWATIAWWRCSGVIVVVFVFSGRGGSFGAWSMIRLYRCRSRPLKSIDRRELLRRLCVWYDEKERYAIRKAIKYSTASKCIHLKSAGPEERQKGSGKRQLRRKRREVAELKTASSRARLCLCDLSGHNASKKQGEIVLAEFCWCWC